MFGVVNAEVKSDRKIECMGEVRMRAYNMQLSAIAYCAKIKNFTK